MVRWSWILAGCALAVSVAACASSGATNPQVASAGGEPPRPEPSEIPPTPAPATPPVIAVTTPAPAEPSPEPTPNPQFEPERYPDTIEANGSVQQLRNRVQQSRRTWTKLLGEHGGRYAYVTGFRSWVGFGSQTTVGVDAGKVVRHAHLAYDRERTITEQWEDAGNEVGKHGAVPLTLEQLYAQCLNEVLTQDPSQHEFYVAFHTDGVLAHCTSRHKACADDCSRGVRVLLVKWDGGDASS